MSTQRRQQQQQQQRDGRQAVFEETANFVLRESLATPEEQLEDARQEYSHGIRGIMRGVLIGLADLAGAILFTFLTTGAWHQALSALIGWLQVLLWLAALGVAIYVGYRAVIAVAEGYITFTHGTELLNDRRARRARQNQLTQASVTVLTSAADVNFAEAQRIRAEAEQKQYSYPMSDDQGNALVRDPHSGQFALLAGNMRTGITSYHHSEHVAPSVKSVTEEPGQSQGQKQLLAGMHIPTFAESMRSGLVGPGQEKVLICYELERDEETSLLTGKLVPYVDDLENNCTMFLGGASKSGKSTLMAHLSGQEAMMNALFYVIDPHLMHPERSITAKIKALSHAFILPPAMTDADVHTVLQHAYAEAKARELGEETRYSGRPIVFIVDEVLNLFGRAQRNPDNKDIQALYRDLSHFMRDLGTQYNKYGINGIFASQYVTKDAFKLPGGANVDFRDGCQNQTLLRLPANQAQAMRLLEREELRGIRQLPPGHGYMGFYDGTIIRMAAGNVTIADIELAGRTVEAAPQARRQLLVPRQYPQGAPSNLTRTPDPTQQQEEGTTQPERGVAPTRTSTPTTGELTRNVSALAGQAVPGTAQGTERVLTTPTFKKRFTAEQELRFVQEFHTHQSIKRVLIEKMHLSYGDYQAYASWLVETRHLRRQ